MDDNENSVTQDPGPFIDMVILANGKPMEEYEAAGAEARILCQTTTYIEDPSNRASEQPFEIEATIDPATRFMSDFIAFRILYNGKERDCRLIEEDECSDAPLVVTYSHDRQGDSYCIPNKYQCRDFVIQVHHSIKGKSMTMGPSGVAEWHGNRYLDEGVPAWEFVYKFRVRGVCTPRPCSPHFCQACGLYTLLIQTSDAVTADKEGPHYCSRHLLRTRARSAAGVLGGWDRTRRGRYS